MTDGSTLDRLCTGGELAGVKITFRFLGIMDTVASAGFFSSIGSAVGIDGGHAGWADADYLLVRESVKSCVHMVAMHELRRNFPVDTVISNGTLPSNCIERSYPGAHSDVGGGYAPGELGMAVGSTVREGDSLKLSQVPLNHMLACAMKAGVPVDQSRAEVNGYNPFKVDPRLQLVYDNFLKTTGTQARPLHQWLQPYINWKWEIAKRLPSQGHWQKANKEDREKLLSYNGMLLEHAAFMNPVADGIKGSLLAIGKRIFVERRPLPPNLDPEARKVYAAARAAPPTSAPMHAMFDGFVHDSLAGFNRPSIEWTGYWRYRKGFLGSRKCLIAAVDENPENPENPEKPVGSYA